MTIGSASSKELKRLKPTASRIREVLNYDPYTGIFTRKKKTGCKGVVGRPVGNLKAHGYISIQIDGHRDYAHRLAWVHMTGRWPKEIDHINGVRLDNRWKNLRLANRTQNNANRRFNSRKKHQHLPKGVIQVTNKDGSLSFYGKLTINGKQICSPAYRHPDNAHLAYLHLAIKYFGEFARAL